jgi:hypothetical protein
VTQAARTWPGLASVVWEEQGHHIPIRLGLHCLRAIIDTIIEGLL